MLLLFVVLPTRRKVCPHMPLSCTADPTSEPPREGESLLKISYSRHNTFTAAQLVKPIHRLRHNVETLPKLARSAVVSSVQLGGSGGRTGLSILTEGKHTPMKKSSSKDVKKLFAKLTLGSTGSQSRGPRYYLKIQIQKFKHAFKFAAALEAHAHAMTTSDAASCRPEDIAINQYA